MTEVSDKSVEKIMHAVNAQDLLKSNSFFLALISEQEFELVPTCPHCEGENVIVIDQTMNLDNHICELHMCLECVQPFLVGGYPLMFDAVAPVYMQVTLKGNGGKPLVEVVPTDVARALMAQACVEEPDDEVMLVD